MQLVSFSVRNFRSITTANKLPIKESTILIGPNNEGKSNILRALVASLEILKQLGGQLRSRRLLPRRLSNAGGYSWERDFPVSLQETKPDGNSVFDLEFRLTDEEVAEFGTEVKSKLNGTLPIRLSVGPDNEVNFKVMKKGPGGPALSKKTALIAKFVASRVNVNYIPAVRTAEAAQHIVSDAVERELLNIERDPEFQAAMNKLDELQRPALERVADRLKSTLHEFLPEVVDVTVQISSESRYRAMRRLCEITVDDGAPTVLDRKGDGVQSLAALSLMRRPLSEISERGEMILAIEEPEAHLHPQAIHQLRTVLADIAEANQVIMTTHCPLFVDRTAIASNILVHGKKAKPAQDVRAIREVLGVRSSDNLQNAELILIVEGEHDRTALRTLLPERSSRLEVAIRQGALGIESLQGGSNLSYKLSQVREAICMAHCFLDGDGEGHAAIEKAEQEGLLEVADYHLANCEGKTESEFEDLLDVNLYKSYVKNKFGVSLDSKRFKSKKKWSARMHDTFKQQGKPWDEKREKQLKAAIADLVERSPAIAINEHHAGSFDALCSALEIKLSLIESGKQLLS